MVSNCQECDDLIRNINREIVENKGFMQNPQEQYNQRSRYLEVLKYTLENNKLYHLYDIWQVFSQARDKATRGFFLDLWDLYNQQEGKYKNQREKDILRYFVGQIHDQFDEILLAKKITAPYLWQKHIQDLIKFMCIEDKPEMELQRKLLYSISHLYVYLYPNKSISVKEEKESLIRQLQIAEAAIFCRTIKGKPTINLLEIFDNDENSNLAKEFTRSFLYLYRFANHFGTVSLEDFVARAIESLKEEKFIERLGQETGRKILEQLLRYWGATASLMRFFLQEKLNFKFYEYHEEKPIELPSPHGTDNFVYTIGASGVGKTYLFHAMEHFSNTNKEQLPLSIEYIDASEENKKLDREKWEKGEELEVRENYLMEMRSKVRHLCRFTFSEIEDTHIVLKESTVTKRQSLQGYFERRLPSVIILVFSTKEEDNLKSYDFLINLLDRLAEKDERYRNIPIYFTFNQSDRLLANKQSPEGDPQMFDKFQSYLNSEVELSRGFNFFSLRYQPEDKQINPLEIANRTEACCANLAFAHRLNYDLKRVQNIINRLLNANFTNLSFIYTCSLFEADSRYHSLQTLWSDLSSFIIKATYKNVESYYRREFKEKLTSDFRKVDLFFGEAAMTSSLEIDRDIFKSLNKAPNFDVMRKDFNNVLKTIENNRDRDASDILSLISGFEPIQSALISFVQEKEFIDSFLTKLLRANLKELGMPLEQSYIYNTKTSQFIDFYVREIEFIEPDTINYYDNIWWFNAESRNVDYFIEDPEYQPVAREIRDIFFKIITDYNNGKPKQHQIQINQDNLETIIKLLPRQLRAFDIANRSEAFEASINDKFLFSKVLDNEIALCRVQCGKFDDRDRSLISGTGSEQTIFERFCELDDEEESKKYCQLLSNYLPKYPKKPKYSQFILVKRHESDEIKVEFDEIKISVVTNLEQKLKEQQNLLLKMISILSKNWRQFKSIDLSISNKHNYEEYIVNLYLAQYLLKILKAQGFDVKLFQEKPQEIISLILNLFSKIANLLERTQKSKTQINLDDFREDYQSIKLSRNLLSLNSRDIPKQAKEIELELKTAFIIYQEIFDRVDRDEERLKSLLEDIIQQSSFLQTNEYNNFLKVYEKKRKLLIIQERVEYLRTSKWIEDLQWLNDSFREYTNIIWGNLTSIDPKKIKQLLTENIDELLKRELFSQNK
ncbi:hypothetical protein [Myxosarcina sp. GI1]|uniref:hypothetical protein n=1 Tax=Myxosarcina sp. GI1 TaxID=1541065 RepID=UPI000562D3B3|nr:hypothetical protein [Myxosarcina sp. GI1]